jgi:hypothetical protein
LSCYFSSFASFILSIFSRSIFSSSIRVQESQTGKRLCVIEPSRA